MHYTELSNMAARRDAAHTPAAHLAPLRARRSWTSRLPRLRRRPRTAPAGACAR